MQPHGGLGTNIDQGRICGLKVLPPSATGGRAVRCNGDATEEEAGWASRSS
jgi:hypothetical protein